MVIVTWDDDISQLSLIEATYVVLAVLTSFCTISVPNEITKRR